MASEHVQTSALTPHTNMEHLLLNVTDKDLPRHIVNGYGHFHQFKKFTEGGTATLEECMDKNLGRRVIIKRLHPHLKENPTELKRFLREARVTALIQHPATVPVYEIGRDNHGDLYFTMKKVDGENMREILANIVAKDENTIRRFPLNDLISVLVQVGQAVAFAHSRGVVHRDLKPANVLVGEFGEVMVLDWGLAKVWNAHETSTDDDPEPDPLGLELTRAGKRCGTPLYMSPEQASGKVDSVDARSDVYSLGSILYEVLTHENLVWGENKEEVLDKILNVDPMPPEKRAPLREIPPQLSSICMKAINRDPTQRYQTMVEMVDDLQAYLQHEYVEAHEYTAIERFANWEHKHALLTVAIGSTLMGSFLTLILMALSNFTG